ncbi:MAG: AmmeMemoRadiSam system protein B [Phycisphaerae bacterium]
MMVREPAYAGQYYPAQRDTCRDEVHRLTADAPDRRSPGEPQGGVMPIGGIVPHSSWAFCGHLVAGVIRELTRVNDPQVVVLVGGTHRSRTSVAAMFGSGRWETPLGSLKIDARLAERIAGQTNLIVDDPYAHESEHGLEVITPFIAHFLGPISILPIIVPATGRAFEVGEAIGRTLKLYGYRALVVGTTDLTHYGPAYDFMPRGEGEAGYRWAKYENDRRFIDMVQAMRGRELVEEANRNRNASDSGAIAATLAISNDLQGTGAELIAHTHSREVLACGDDDLPGDTVGFASFLLH